MAPTLAPSPIPVLSLPCKEGALHLAPYFPFLKPCEEAVPSFQPRCVLTSLAHFSACRTPRTLSLLVAFPEGSTGGSPQAPQLGSSSRALEHVPGNPLLGPY